MDFKKNTLFQYEIDVLQESKNKLEDNSDINWEQEYKDLVIQYEKLLKNTMKTYRISDIQGKMLKDRENEIKRVNENLQFVEEARRKLISEISHEMGAPLIAVLSYTKALMDGKIESDRKNIQSIYERILMVNKLVKDLFELSKLELNMTTFEIKPIPLSYYVSHIEENFHILVKDHDIEFIIQMNLEDKYSLKEFFIHIDTFRMEQVFNNLIYNALKFTPKDGSITITFTPVLKKDKENPHLLIDITDTGEGIEKEFLPRIFERFFKASGNTNKNGSGLGLSITKEIIEKHNGTITVKSILNKGTTFTVMLPLSVNS